MSTTQDRIIKQIEDLDATILSGHLLAIDPASRNLGYAVYVKGKLRLSGVIKSKLVDVNMRLRILMDQLHDKLLEHKINPTVMAIEKIRGANSHIYLHWSVGAIIAEVRPDHLIEVPIPMWKKLVTESYTKTDENDAILIGQAVIQVAEAKAKRRSAAKKRRK